MIKPFYFEALPKIIEHITHSQEKFENTSIYCSPLDELQEKVMNCRWPKKDGIVVIHTIGKKRGIFRAHIVSRLTIPIVILIEIFVADIFQTFRGINTIIGGVIDLDYKKLGTGTLDLISVAVQTFVFPIFTLLAVLSPDWTKIACMYCEAYGSNTFEVGYRFEVSRRIMSVVSGVFLTLATFPTGIIEGFRHALLDWRWETALISFGSSLISITYIFFGVYGLCDRPTSKMYSEKLWGSTIIAYTVSKTHESSDQERNATKSSFHLGSVYYYA